MPYIFPLLQWQRNLILLFPWYKILCKTWKNTCEFHFYCWGHVYEWTEWCLVDYFHRKVTASTQIMVHSHCIVKCKKFSTCGRLLMALQAIFLWFKIFTLIFCDSKNIYINWNLDLPYQILTQLSINIFKEDLCSAVLLTMHIYSISRKNVHSVYILWNFLFKFPWFCQYQHK